MNLIYIVPKKEELGFRKQLVEDPKTMAYNKNIVPFPKEKWDSWFDKWIGKKDPNYYYAYIFDKDINSYVGEIAYRKETDMNVVTLNIIIDYKYRGKGYGKEGLKGLVITAFKNGWNEVRDLIAEDNYGSQKLFSDFGFQIVNPSIDGGVDFRMTKEKFIEKYGDLK